jgi:hypothetical protein
MRVFQNIFAYSSYISRLGTALPRSASFDLWLRSLVDDRYCAVHYLEPSAEGTVSLTCATNYRMQRAWASEHGMSFRTTQSEILLAQIEEHRADVFYTQDPGRYGPDFLRRLPGCVRCKVCWQSPPAPAGNLTGYDFVLNNFPTSLAEYAGQGVHTAYFTPSYDPAMQESAMNSERPIDVVFVGGYSRHHSKRAAVLEEVAMLADRYKIVFALDRSRLTRIAESPLGGLLSLTQHRRPAPIQAVTVNPVFGREMYHLFSQAKIVLNGAVDSAGADRGNMRCFEALGCGTLMLSDAGHYPEGMVDGETMVLYQDGENVRSIVESLLIERARLQSIAASGHKMLRKRYTKAAQWRRFVEIVGLT